MYCTAYFGTVQYRNDVIPRGKWSGRGRGEGEEEERRERRGVEGRGEGEEKERRERNGVEGRGRGRCEGEGGGREEV